jgi:uncharacterized protein YjbI with pentapeptide repeats
LLEFLPSMTNATQNDVPAARTCLVKMLDGNQCGRQLLGPVFDLSSHCVMHIHGSKDDTAFQTEFERILDEAGDGMADFSSFVFPSANYEGRKFEAHCVFSRATFAQHANFRGATFAQDVSFIGSTFAQEAHFWDAVFRGEAHFAATFAQQAGFAGATFDEDVRFSFSKFTEDVIFNGATFGQRANFSRTSFLGSAEFRETKFRADEGLSPGPIFSLAEFTRPEEAIFYKTYLGRSLFHNCDVSKLNFSSVEWRRRKDGKRMMFEEVVTLDDRAAAALNMEAGSSHERDYGLIAELYQQLKKNYDERKDYWTAGDFHYGEMEMKRLHSPGRNRWAAGWLHRNLGLTAWYKYASQYGESYIRPAIVLSIVLAIFTLLFPWAGLDRNENTTHSSVSTSQQAPSSAALSELSYKHFNNFVLAYPGRKWIGTAAFFGNSLMTVLSVAGFQKELKYEPSYPWGRALALLELLLTSTLIALFLLAVRRQFKR